MESFDRDFGTPFVIPPQCEEEDSEAGEVSTEKEGLGMYSDQSRLPTARVSSQTVADTGTRILISQVIYPSCRSPSCRTQTR